MSKGALLIKHPSSCLCPLCKRIEEYFSHENLLLSVSGIEKAVCADISSRQKMGIEKYGTSVADNPLSLREWLQHAYEETLDKAIYLKRAIAEIDAKENPASKD